MGRGYGDTKVTDANGNPVPEGVTPPVPRRGANEGAANTTLDWSVVSKNGESRVDHVESQHGNLNLQKPAQGVFYGDPVAVTNDAWSIAQNMGIKPITEGGKDIYIVPRPNSGYAGGYSGQLQNLDTMTIITVAGTNKVITAYPGNATPLPKAPTP